MTRKRLKELQEKFLTYYRNGVHGNGGFGKPGSYATGALECQGFDSWELAYGGFVVGTMNRRNAEMLRDFDPVVWQEMLDSIATSFKMPTIRDLINMRDIELKRAEIERRQIELTNDIKKLRPMEFAKKK